MKRDHYKVNATSSAQRDETHLELHVHNLMHAGVISNFEKNKFALQMPTQYSLKNIH